METTEFANILDLGYKRKKEVKNDFKCHLETRNQKTEKLESERAEIEWV